MLIVTTFNSVIYAQSKAKPNSATQLENSLLWKISGNGLTKDSYLFGTIHIICESDYLWNATLQRCFDQTEDLCVEIDVTNPEVTKEIMKLGSLTDNKTLKDFFTPLQYDSLSTYVTDNFGFDINAMKTFKPFFIYSFMGSKIDDCVNTKSYELTLIAAAKEKNKSVLSIESLQNQLDALNAFSDAAMATEIMKTVRGEESMTKEFDQLVATYKAQNITELVSIINKSEMISGNEEVLLTKRNRDWINSIGEKSKSKSVFYAVGAGHLAGENGVIVLLRKAGYKVEPILN